MNKFYIKTFAKLGMVILLTTVQIATAQVPILLNEVVSTTDRFGNKVCFRIVAMCFNSVDSCGPRCVIDGNIYLADCMTKRVYDTLDYETLLLVR